jgi:succinate dehydrogenase hydrophobic anchor subunit
MSKPGTEVDLPFTTTQFFDVFAHYNRAIWPLQFALAGAALTCVVLLYAPAARAGRAISLLLALLWAWMALAYHIAFFTAINPAAWLFGALFVAAAVAFGWVGAAKGTLEFESPRGARGAVGATLVLFALAVYPALGYLLGHRYPASPTFGLPCPTTIFTLGMLLFAKPPVPWKVYAIPMMWSLIGASAALELGVREDFSLLVAGLAFVTLVLRQRLARRAES